MSAALAPLDSGFASRTLAEMAAKLPGVTGIFRHDKLDFCCGEKVRLADAAPCPRLFWKRNRARWRCQRHHPLRRLRPMH